MKKLFVLFSFIAGVAFLLAACSNVTLFNKVQVKGAPSIYAPLGGTKVEVKDFLTAEKISEMLGKDSKFKVYNYTGDADSKALTFLMEYPIMEMPLNFDEYLGKLDLSKMDTSIPKMEFSIPTLDFSLASQTVAVPGGEDLKGQTLNEQSAQLLNQTIGQNKSLAIEERKITLKSEGLKSAVFAEGNKITLTMEPTIEGISVSSANISMTLPGGSEEINFTDTNNAGTYTANLGKKTISNGDFVIKGIITVTASVTAGTRIPAEGIGVKIEMGLDLGKGFESATIAVPAGTSLDQTVNTPLPEEMTKLVSSITFNSIGAKVTLNNGLPAGNDIDISVSSTALNMTGQKKTFAAGKESTGTFSGTNLTLQPATLSEIDMKMKVELPGYKSADNTFTVQNVKPREKYSVGGSVAFEVDWKEAAVKTTDKPFEGSYPAGGGEPMKLSDLWNMIPKGIMFKEIGAYLYMEAPMDIQMSGYMTMNEKSLWGSKDKPEKLSKSTAPTGPAEGDWNTKLDPTQASMDLSDTLLKIMNERPDSLSFKYSLSANEVNIKKEEVSGTQSLRAVLLMKLPLELEVDSSQMAGKPEDLPFEENGVPIDVFTLAKVYSDEPDANNDLFKREEPWSLDDEINKLLNQLQSLKMELDYTNDLGMSLGAWFYDSRTGISKNFTLEQGSGTINLDFGLEEIKNIIQVHPFSPQLYVFLPDTTPEEPFVLNRDGKLDFTLTVAAAADIDYTYDLKGGK